MRNDDRPSYSRSMTRREILYSFFYFLSPCVLAILFTLVCFIIAKSTFSGDTSEFTYQVASLFVPAFFVLGGLVIFTRFICKKKIVWMWLIEGPVVLFLLFYFIF